VLPGNYLGRNIPIINGTKLNLAINKYVQNILMDMLEKMYTAQQQCSVRVIQISTFQFGSQILAVEYSHV
jgi:hypothetical protein